MNVGEIIEELRRYPPYYRVVITSPFGFVDEADLHGAICRPPKPIDQLPVADVRQWNADAVAIIGS